MKSISVVLASILSFSCASALAEVYTNPQDIAEIVTQIEPLNKKIVGLSSVSTQKFQISKVDIYKSISDTDIGICYYGYKVFLTNLDSNVKEALKGSDFFEAEHTVLGKCKF